MFKNHVVLRSIRGHWVQGSPIWYGIETVNFPRYEGSFPPNMTQRCQKPPKNEGIHPSLLWLTGSRCLASEAAYWLMFVFFSTFLLTCSTCPACHGCLSAGRKPPASGAKNNDTATGGARSLVPCLPLCPLDLYTAG